MQVVRLGMIGGVGPAAAANMYIRVVALFRKQTGGRYPDIVMHSLPITVQLERAFIEGQFSVAEEREIISLMSQSRDVLLAARISGIAVACNTLHPYLPTVLASHDVECIDIIQTTLKRLHEENYERVALIATTGTVRSGLYTREGRRMGVHFVLPGTSDQSIVAATITSLLRGTMSSGQAEDTLRGVVQRLPGRLDAVVLGCTDLGEVELADSLGIPVVDSLSCLAQASCEYLLSSHAELALLADGHINGSRRAAQVARVQEVLAAPGNFPLWAYETASWVADTVGAPSPALGRSGALCPFVPAALETGGLGLLQCDLSDSEHVDQGVSFVRETAGRFERRAFSRPLKEAVSMSWIVVFPLLRDKASVLADICLAIKPLLLSRGLTCGEFYQENSDVSVRNDQVLIARSPWPCIAIRLSTPHDELFLRRRPDLHEIFRQAGPGIKRYERQAP